MKTITMLYLKTCPHCQKALALIKDVEAHQPSLAQVKINMIEGTEHPAVVDQYQFSEYPAFYFGDKLIHQGPVTKEDIEHILRQGL